MTSWSMDTNLPPGVHHAAIHTPVQPLFPSLAYPMSAKVVRNYGQLSWLSPKAGLIRCQHLNATISFQLKDFCDQGVTDFTAILRPGFLLSFQAIVMDETREWIANFVSPISDAEKIDCPVLNLDEYESNLPPESRLNAKDPYSQMLEIQSLTFLLSIFQKNGTHTISLSSLHSRISNAGRDDLSKYIGSSSLKRRQFIERRSYIFHVTEHDVVFLQPAEIYTTVIHLASFLLQRGGATSSDTLFNYFNSTQSVPSIVKDSIQKDRHKFMEFLNQHPFAFVPFPSQYYVAARRNLPYFEYGVFIQKNFPGCVYGQAMNASLNYQTPVQSQHMSAFNFDTHMVGSSSLTQTPVDHNIGVSIPRGPWADSASTTPEPLVSAVKQPMNPVEYIPTNTPMQPMKPKTVSGTGRLCWLSPKAGLIECENMNATVSFQLKDFCDQGVTDFNSILRAGFLLSFQATAPDDSREWIASYVSPVVEGSDNRNNPELNLEEFESKLPISVRQNTKDPYGTALEIYSLSYLLCIFQKNGTHSMALSALHSRISNAGIDVLYKYIGSSSLKRRQFIERRSHIFHVTEHDVVFLQPAEIYTTVIHLASFLLQRGGATSSDTLFNYFNSTQSVPSIVKDSIQKDRHKFMEFLNQHPFAFVPFPSQYYVAARRNLPCFEYGVFIQKNFPGCVYGQAMNASLNYQTPVQSQHMSAFNFDTHMVGSSSLTQTPVDHNIGVSIPRGPWADSASTAPEPLVSAVKQPMN